MAWISQLLKGAKVAGKALRKKGLRSSGTDAIKSVKPGVGGLKESRKTFEGLQKSTAEGVRKFGRPHTTKVLSDLKGPKTMGGITKQAGDLERKKKDLIKKHPEVKGRLGFSHGKRVGHKHNTSRENRLEELGRVDAERAWTKHGKRNLKLEKHRIKKELN